MNLFLQKLRTFARPISKRSFTSIVWIAMMALFTHEKAAAQTTLNYCVTPSTLSFSGCQYGDQVSSFSTTGGATNITNNNSGCSANGYGNFTATQIHTTIQGATVNFSITTGSYGGGLKIWVDWNIDGDWADFGEEVFAPVNQTNANTTVTGSFAVPANASIGTTRLRARFAYATTNFTSCSNVSYGEAEDYGFVVNAAPPCTNATAGIASIVDSICSGIDFSLVATGFTVASGISYQWQQATLTGPFSNIVGATSPSYLVSGGIATSARYRLVVVCSLGGGSSDTSNIETVYVRPFTQCYCTPYTTACFYYYNITNFVMGSISNNTGTGCPVTAPYGYNNFTNLSTSIMQGNNLTATVTVGSAGSVGLRAWVDWNNNGLFDATEVVYTSPANTFVNTTTTFSFFIPFFAAAGPHRMRVRTGYFDYGPDMEPCETGYYYGETEDYTVNVLAAPACAGVPNAGTAIAPDSVCPSIAFNITDTGYTLASGLAFQWQSRPVGATTWANIAGATTPLFAVTAGITSSTSYRMRLICTNTNDTAYSNTRNVYVRPATQCYCTPQYSNGCGFADDINDFSLTGANSTSFNQVGTGCTVGGYANYTNLTPVQMVLGNNYTGSISSNFSSQYANIWIDFNDNGIFASNEIVSSISGYGPTAVTYTLAVPNAPTGVVGLHRMRVRGVYFGTLPLDPCNLQTYGETHDYMVLIIGIPPAPLLTNNSPNCAGAPITITATSPAPAPRTFTLTGPGITTPLTNSTGIFTVNPTAAGTYSVTVTSYTYTSPAGTTAVTVLPQPTIAQGTVTSPTSCGGGNGSITLTGLLASTTYTLNYIRNSIAVGPLTVVSDANGVVTVSNLSAGSYTTITLTSSAGCVSNVLGPIGVNDPNPPVPPTASYNPPLCLGSTLVLSASSIYSNATYTWTGPGLSPTTGTTVTRPNLQYIDTGLYSVTVTVAGCISAPGTVRVFINPPPAAPTTTAVSFCQFSTATPLTATGQNLRWYTAATGGTALPSAPVPNTTVAGNQTFYVSQTANTCEGPRASLVVTIKARPDVPLSDTARELCQYQAAPALTATGSSILWYATATGAGGSTAAPVPATTAPGVYFFYVTQTVNGCESERLRIRVTVKPKPAPPVVVSPLRLCQYEGADPLTAQGQNLLWYNVPNGGGALPGTPTPPTAYEDTTAFYVSQTVNGCESDRALLTVTVNYKPNATILASKEFVCQYDTIAFNYFGNGRTSAQYNWSVEGPGQILSGQGTQGPVLVSYTAPGYYAIRLVVDNNGCLSPVTTKVIEVRAQPRFRIAMQPEGCEDQPIDIVATGATAGIDSFRWDFGGGVPVSGSFNGGPYTVSWEDAGVKVVSVQVLTRECGSAMTYDTIRIEETPVASIGRVSNGAVCDGDTVRLTAQYNPAYTYNWSPAAFFGGSRASTVDALISKTGYVGLEVVTGIGCRATDSVLLSVKSCCEVFVPTAFSPNGDGNNDRFRVVSGGFQSLSAFRVTNRWGRTVWETGAQSGGWDGTVNGAAADMGTYFWYLKYTCTDGKIYEKQGEVTLVR